jgi:hypothetical protein
MKTLIPLTALAALVASSTAFAQTPAFSKPSGYVTETFKPGQFSLFGLTLNNASIASGTITAISSSSVSDSTKNFTNLLTAGQTYVFEITRPGSTALGSFAEVTTWTGAALTTTPTNLTLLGAAVGDTYTLRKASTIADVFGATNQAGLLQGNSNTADVIWISDGAGVLTRYYYANAQPPAITAGWRRIGGGNTNAANIPILSADGVILQRRGLTDLTLVHTGEVKTIRTSYAITTNAFNYIGGSFPVGSTLASSGLQGQVTAGNTNTADIVWVPNGLGGYTRYYFATAQPPAITAGWRSIGGGNTDRSTVPLTSGIIIQRRGATSNMTISPPASYSNL